MSFSLFVKSICVNFSDITDGADFLSYAVLIHLLWPSRSILYLIKGESPLPTFELEITGIL